MLGLQVLVLLRQRVNLEHQKVEVLGVASLHCSEGAAVVFDRLVLSLLVAEEMVFSLVGLELESIDAGILPALDLQQLVILSFSLVCTFFNRKDAVLVVGVLVPHGVVAVVLLSVVAHVLELDAEQMLVVEVD